MQKYCSELTDRLLKSLDKEYNVVDMAAVVDVITALEKTTITKEVLESTRLGKYINELRRKTTNDALAKRAKDLVRRWRDMVLPSSHNSYATSIETTPGSQYQASLNGTKPQSPLARMLKQPPQSPAGLRGIKPQSPANIREIKPQSPLLRDITPMKVLSPALSLTSDQNSRSPNLMPVKQSSNLMGTNYRLNSTASPKLSSSNQNHLVEAVPRTHSSNKRLRKDDITSNLLQNKSLTAQLSDVSSKDDLTIAKKQRLNGENTISINSQVPSPLSSSRDQNSLDLSVVTTSNNPELEVGPKKRGRKKGSKSLKNQQLPEDRVKEKLASISRNPKLKTTQELLADLQARGSNPAIAGTVVSSQSTRRTEPPTTEEILRSSDVNNRTKFATSSRREIRVPNIAVAEPEITLPIISTVEEILAKLPPLDLDSIRWSDDDNNEETNGNDNEIIDQTSPREITNVDVDRLHNECIEGLNGNFQLKVTRTDDELTRTEISQESETMKKLVGVYKRRIDDDTDREFREWHEMLARPSYDGQILHILPYVIID